MSDPGSYNILQVDPWFLERIDVIKGPSSALYGQTVPGGLVMETSKRPQFIQEGHFHASTATNSTNSAAFDYTNTINDQWAFRLTGITRNSNTQYAIRNTQYDHTREENTQFHLRFSGSLTKTPLFCCALTCKKTPLVAIIVPYRATAALPNITAEN